jgi:AmpE protein
MLFLSMILALVLLQAWGGGEPVQRDRWYRDWQGRIANWDVGAPVRLALAVLAPVLVAQLLLGALEPLVFGLPWIVAAAVLLLYSFGRGDFQALTARYRAQCRSGDFEGACLGTLEELGVASPEAPPGSTREVHALVLRGMIYEGYQRWFPVLFYFVLFGPAGALGYRLLQLCARRFEPYLTDRALYLVDWVPVRLLAATFALTGSFVHSRDALFGAIGDTGLEADELLDRVGRAALELEEPPGDDADFGEQAAREAEDAAGMLSRSAAGWVAVTALLVLLD